MNYFYEVCTRYGVAGYYTSQESVKDIFESRYKDIKYLVKKYKYDEAAGGGRVWAFFYQDSAISSAFASNNRAEVLKIYSQFADIGCVSGDNILNSYTLNELPSDVQLILNSLNYTDECENADTSDAATDAETMADTGAETATDTATATDTVTNTDTDTATIAETAATTGVTAVITEPAATNAENAGNVVDSPKDDDQLTHSQIIELTEALDLSEQFS